MEQLTYDSVQRAVSGTAAAFRCRRRLQPGGGPGHKVFPLTFAGAVYAIEPRRVPGRHDPVTCVLLDSVQSQANRMELVLQEAADEAAGLLIDRAGEITSLQVLHRLADATPLFVCPTALVSGCQRRPGPAC